MGIITPILPVPGKYFMVYGALDAVITQVHRHIKMEIPDFKELLICLMLIQGRIMMAISFNPTFTILRRASLRSGSSLSAGLNIRQLTKYYSFNYNIGIIFAVNKSAIKRNTTYFKKSTDIKNEI